MLKLVKIIGAVSGAPECLRLPAKDGETVHYGGAMKLCDGSLTAAGAGERPGYVVAERCVGPDGTLLVFPVNDTMQFCTPLIANDESAVRIGDKVSLAFDEDGNDGVAPDTAGCGEIIAIHGDGLVYVKFTK